MLRTFITMMKSHCLYECSETNINTRKMTYSVIHNTVLRLSGCWPFTTCARLETDSRTNIVPSLSYLRLAFIWRWCSGESIIWCSICRWLLLATRPWRYRRRCRCSERWSPRLCSRTGVKCLRSCWYVVKKRSETTTIISTATIIWSWPGSIWVFRPTPAYIWSADPVSANPS